eukprot:3784393-Prymnesium_polylepis.1
MVASRNGREGLELNASQDGGGVLTPGRLETRRGRLKCQRVGVSSCLMSLEMVVSRKRNGGGPISWMGVTA